MLACCNSVDVKRAELIRVLGHRVGQGLTAGDVFTYFLENLFEHRIGRLTMQDVERAQRRDTGPQKIRKLGIQDRDMLGLDLPLASAHRAGLAALADFDREQLQLIERAENL